MESVSCNLQTGSDFPQLASTCSDCKIRGNQGKNRVVYSRLYLAVGCRSSAWCVRAILDPDAADVS